MLHREFTLLFLIASGLLFHGCATVSRLETNELHGMVYDSLNRPVCNYEIDLNGHYSAKTDFGGRFYISQVKAGNYRLTGAKPGFETISEDVEVSGQKVLYVQVKTREDMYSEILSEMENQNWEQAEALTDSYNKTYHGDSNTWFFKSLLNFKKKDYKTARRALSKTKQNTPWTKNLSKMISEKSSSKEEAVVSKEDD